VRCRDYAVANGCPYIPDHRPIKRPRTVE
jgi:hypothetical protein